MSSAAAARAGVNANGGIGALGERALTVAASTKLSEQRPASDARRVDADLPGQRVDLADAMPVFLLGAGPVPVDRPPALGLLVAAADLHAAITPRSS
jgi:hypothetical protein